MGLAKAGAPLKQAPRTIQEVLLKMMIMKMIIVESGNRILEREFRESGGERIHKSGFSESGGERIRENGFRERGGNRARENELNVRDGKLSLCIWTQQ